MKQVFMFPYKQGSKSASALSNKLNVKRIKIEGSAFKPRGDKTIINWGSTQLPQGYLVCNVLNPPKLVEKASNKLSFFTHIKQWNEENPEESVLIPEFYTDKESITKAQGKGYTVFARTKLNAHSGEGIVVIKPEDKDIPNAALYTRYIPKNEEYRIHVVGEKVCTVQRKARNKDVADDKVNWQVRNHDNGFIFQREGFDCPGNVKEAAIKTIKALSLDFGAVDIIYTKAGRAFVLEVNTAPGLEGTTLTEYVAAFKEMLE